MQIVHIVNWCTWLAHTLCKGLIWNYKNCWAQPSLTCIWDPASASMKLGMYRVSFFWPIQDFVLRFWNQHYFHILEGCICLFFFKNCIDYWIVYTFLLILFSFLAATKQLYKWYFLSVCLSVCHIFLTMLQSSYHHEIFRSYHQGPV